MRFTAFAGRTGKEILRDPLTLFFCAGLPVILLVMISLISSTIPAGEAPQFELDNFVPGIAVFSFSFISLFAGILIANDRESSFLMRVFASPLSGKDYILGYTLPLLAVAVAQSAVCFIVAFLLGLKASINVLFAMVILLPCGLLFIGIGIITGTFFTSKQVGGISSILINLATWLSGTWFQVKLIGGVFETICYLLPFAHAVDAAKAALRGNYSDLLPHLLWVTVYAAVIFIAAVYAFHRKVRN